MSDYSGEKIGTKLARWKRRHGGAKAKQAMPRFKASSSRVAPPIVGIGHKAGNGKQDPK